MERHPSDVPTHSSKEAKAIAAFGAAPEEPVPPRRVRRRRRSLRHRLFNGLLPFAVLIGLTLLAAGVVRVVEVGAAKRSKVLIRDAGKSHVEPRSLSRLQPLDSELVQMEYREVIPRRAAGTPGAGDQFAEPTISSNSTSKISAAPPGIAGGRPASP